MFWLLTYDVVDDYTERRVPLRSEHLDLARAAAERGELVLGGALADPPDRAVLVFRTDDRSVVEDFVHRDPYVRHGLVEEWHVRAWSVVVGTAAADS